MVFNSRQLLGGLLMLGISIVSIPEYVVPAQELAVAKSEISGYEVEFPALGTLVSIKVFSSDEALVTEAIRAAELRTHELENILTDYDPESETSQLTELAARNEFVTVSPELWKVLQAADYWHQVSQGAFDASLGALSQLWRVQRKSKKPLEGEKFDLARQHCGWEHVQIKPESNSVRFDRSGIRLDFGAIGKGYVVDEIFHVLQSNGIKSCLVNISGNMRCGAPPPGRQGWRVAIAPLEQHQPPFRNLLLCNIAIATSGDLWQYALVDGQRLSHILDPRTGRSVRGPISATILAATAMHADACATAVCVLGPSAGAQLVTGLPDFEALILEHNDPQQPVRYLVTPGFAKRL